MIKISKNSLQQNSIVIKFSESTKFFFIKSAIFLFADFSHGIEFILNAVIGQYNLRTIFLHSSSLDIQRERKTVDKGLKLKVPSSVLLENIKVTK